MSTTYREQLGAPAQDIDLAFWRAPQGVEVPDDELRFLLVPEAVQTLACAALAAQVHAFQAGQAATDEAIDLALMITMGGLLPGVLMHDHLGHAHVAAVPPIPFSTLGVSLYKGPDERFAAPTVTQDAAVSVTGKNLLLVDDLSDRGETLDFLARHLSDQGARRVMSLVIYMKPAALARCGADFYFGEVAQDTWIINSREQVETLAKRVPVWKSRGASQAECRRRLVDLIGYPPALVDQYLAGIYTRA